jgi:predicted site-specific integrase-resolvase
MSRSVDKLFYTQLEVAAIAGVGPSTIRAWTRAGSIPIFVDPNTGRIRYPRLAIERWTAAMEASPPTYRCPNRS